jgi:GMP synthase (glutamine-hydrolysing)
VRDSVLFEGLPKKIQVWMSHGDKVTKIPHGFSTFRIHRKHRVCGHTEHGKEFLRIQFHPEVVHTPQGQTVITNFCRKISMQRLMDNGIFHREESGEIRETTKGEKVILGLSGGRRFIRRGSPDTQGDRRQADMYIRQQRRAQKGEAERVKDLFGELSIFAWVC